MDRISPPIAVLAVVALVAVGGLGLAQNPEQSGTATTCADFNAAWPADEALARATDNVIAVDPFTNFVVTSQNGTVGEQASEASALTPDAVEVSHQAVDRRPGRVYVDFYDGEGDWVGYNDGQQEGVVPFDAAYGTVCVGMVNSDWPEVPNPDAEWTYQDGY